MPKDELEALLALPLHGPFGNDLLRLGYVKAFMDGTLGSQTARMLDGSGVEITSRDELVETIVRAAERGFPVAVHAIGDRANRDALDAFERTHDVWASRKLRPRIEHAQLLSADDLPRFAQLGVAASVQFSHAPSDRELADRFWGGKTDGAYAYRSLLDSGALLANGSDAPIEELDPWAGVCAGVLRTIDARPAWHPEQRVTLEEALVATCVNPAWLTGDERRRGKLLPGLRCRPRRPRPRPLRRRARRAARRARRRHDARRPLGPRFPALGLGSRGANRERGGWHGKHCGSGSFASSTCGSTRSACRRSSSSRSRTWRPRPRSRTRSTSRCPTRGRRCRCRSALALIACICAATAIGQLAKLFPSAGGLYTYAARSLGPWAGVLVAWLFVGFQPLVAPFLYLEFGWAMSEVFKSEAGWRLQRPVVDLGRADDRDRLPADVPRHPHLDDGGRDPRRVRDRRSSRRSRSGCCSRTPAT